MGISRRGKGVLHAPKCVQVRTERLLSLPTEQSRTERLLSASPLALPCECVTRSFFFSFLTHSALAYPIAPTVMATSRPAMMTSRPAMMAVALLVVVMAAACTATALPVVVDHTAADSDAVGVRKLLQENAINTTDENQVASAGASMLNLTSASRVDWPGCTPTGFIFNARFPAANSPWKVEYNQPYSHGTGNAVWNVCATKNYTYMAALSWRDYGGTPVVELGAAGETAVMTAGRCSTQYHRGFYVYSCSRNNKQSFGFAGNSEVYLNSADTSRNNETYRLSWHNTQNRPYPLGGYRSGTTKALNSNTQWKKAIICSNTCSPMSPPTPPPPPSPPPPNVGDAIKNATDAVKDTIDKAKDAAGAAGNAAGAAGDVPKTGVADLKDESVTVTLGSSAHVYHSLVACVGTLMLWALAA